VSCVATRPATAFADLPGCTLVAVTMGIVAVLRGNLRAHRRSMTLTYIGLCIAGAFTLLPHRILGQIVWQGIGLA
jgi:uncharacterized membrane protein